MLGINKKGVASGCCNYLLSCYIYICLNKGKEKSRKERAKQIE
jgi:hypothetical protein